MAIQSISADQKYKDKIKEAAKLLGNFCTKNGLDVKIINGFENPIVIIKTPFDQKLKTVLVYGHYDVQPAKKEDGWKNNPFRLTETKGKIFGRGTADNKAQILIHIYSVINLLKEKRLGSNVIFLIEGNEETGSTRLRKFLRKHKGMLKADCILVSDSELGPNNIPGLEKSFRGAMNFEVMLETGTDDLHSGLFGGVAPNAAEELSKIIGSLVEFTGRKTGFIPRTKEYERRRTLEPTVEVTGLISGYVENGFKNSIPCKASAKINVRSVPSQDPGVLAERVKKFILSKAPAHTKICFTDGENARGMVLELKNPFAKKARRILKEVYNKEPVVKRGGGTLPVGIIFRDILKVPQVMVPLADENCGAHSASEFISLEAIEKGLQFSARFFSR